MLEILNHYIRDLLRQEFGTALIVTIASRRASSTPPQRERGNESLHNYILIMPGLARHSQLRPNEFVMGIIVDDMGLSSEDAVLENTINQN